jgi:hypothetical protein
MFWIWLGGVLAVVLLAAKLYDRRHRGHLEARQAHREGGGYDAVRFPQSNDISFPSSSQ